MSSKAAPHYFSGEPAPDSERVQQHDEHSVRPPMPSPDDEDIALGARGMVTMFNRFYGSF